MLLDLPLDIIERIIILSSNVLTTYNNILILCKFFIEETNTIQNKRKRTTDTDTYTHTSNHSSTKYLSIYNFLLNNTTINNIYKHSGWYKCFINKNINHNINNYHQIQFNIINQNINILKPILLFNNLHNHNHNHNEYIGYIEYIDNTINIHKLHKLQLLIIEIEKAWKINVNTIDRFLLLIIVLTSGDMFKKNLLIDNYLSMRFMKDNEESDNHSNHINHYNNFIPLFQKCIGMGYSFNIGWDIGLEQCVGFIYGGSSAEDYEFFEYKLQSYLYKTKIERLNYIKKNKINIKKQNLIEMLVVNDKSISYYEKYCCNSN